MKQILSIFLLLAALSCKSQKTLMFPQTEIPKPQMNDQTILQWNENQPGYSSLSRLEKEFLYWVNYSRKNPRSFFENAIMPIVKIYPQLRGSNLNSLENDLKGSPSLTLLQLNPVLVRMSEFHARDITVSNANPSHNSTNGESFVDRFKKFGFKNCGGENISYGGGDTDPLFMLIMLYLDINVDNLGHRKALLNSSFVNTGISIAKYKNGNTFLVEDFACSQ
ncbi:CAP domain-containing protein [Parafilimonas sp.]|uniref:CAP domain-containing protein n=1 Tax=Parafilimonas sp. TaxID=1969739 RepID=UPI0039E488A1